MSALSRPFARFVAVAFVVVVGAAGLVSAPAHATTVVALDDASLAERASLVVVATVASVQTSEHTVVPHVFTDVTLIVERTLGLDVDSPGELVVRMPGGRVDTRVVHVPGMPEFVAGEVVLLFLEPQPDAFDDGAQTWIPVGLEQGVWRPSGVDMWVRTLGHVHHIGAPTTAPEPLGLDAIEAMIAAPEAP